MTPPLSVSLREVGLALARRATAIERGEEEAMTPKEIRELALGLLQGAQQAKLLALLGPIPVERPPARAATLPIRPRPVVHEGGRAS
jgi:hypothetical protein